MIRRETVAGAVLLALSACAGSTGHRVASPEVYGRPFAEVTELSGASPVLGATADGEPGDWLLQNERLAVVVQGLHRRTGFALSGGNIIDAAPTGGDDCIQQIFTYFDDTFPRQAVYESLTEATPVGSPAVSLVARGHDSENPEIEVETRYTISPGSSYLELVTTVTNRGPESVNEFELGDAIEWGRAESFAPGPGHAMAGTQNAVPFVLRYGDGTSYGWVSLRGGLTGRYSDAWSDPIVMTADLDPGESVSYTRRLIVKRGSPSRAAEAMWTMRGRETGSLSVRVEGEHGHPVAGANIIARNADGAPATWGVTSAEGAVILSAPVGEYTLEIFHPNRGNATARGTLASEPEAEVTIELPEPARLGLSARDGEGRRCPARWTFTGLEETPNPRLGPRYQITGAGNYVFTAGGRGETLLPPGKYRVTATRGPAYESWETDIVLDAGETRSLAAEIERLVPENWVAADFHVHTLRSHDCAVTPEDRARSLVCEGVEWFVASDHDYRTDFSSALEAADLPVPLHAVVGEEVTTARLGHFGVFPLDPDSDAGDERPSMTEANDVNTVFSRLREERDDVLIQVNHPRQGRNGYFDLAGYVSPDSSSKEIRLDFDLLEVANGGRMQTFEQVWEDWMRLLESGHRIVGVGNSDSHSLAGEEVGYPRNYVRMDSLSDLSDETEEETFLDAVREGHVMVSNGPFIDFTLEGAGVGATVRHSRGTVKGHLRVIAPSWVDVRRVAIVVNGVEEAIYMVRGRDRPVRFDEDIEIDIRTSSFVVARVEGESSLAPVLSPTEWRDEAAIMRPLAFTNPIWVEVE